MVPVSSLRDSRLKFLLWQEIGFVGRQTSLKTLKEIKIIWKVGEWHSNVIEQSKDALGCDILHCFEVSA